MLNFKQNPEINGNVKKMYHFWFKKCLSLWIFLLPYISKKCAIVTFGENPQMKMNSLMKQKHWYLIICTWLDEAFKGAVVNRTWSGLSLHVEKLEITLTVLLKH